MENSVKLIALDKLTEHPDNPNRMSKAAFGKLIGNIKETGLYEPLIVRSHPKRKGYFQIINGHHRCKALAKLGYKQANAIVWDVDDRQTQILLMSLNRLTGADVLEKKLAILKKLRRQMDSKVLAKFLPHTPGQIEKLISLKLPDRPVGMDAKSLATALVFFVNQGQLRKIEEAINKAPVNYLKTGRAKGRAIALEQMAESFLKVKRKNSPPSHQDTKSKKKS